MTSNGNEMTVYMPSQDIVAREIEGELIIVPIYLGAGNLEEELFSLNETGRAIWKRLDGARSIRAIATELAEEYDAPPETIIRDVLGIIHELLQRKMIVEAPAETTRDS